MADKRLECKGAKDVRHVGCGGQIAVSGWATQKLPLGFGFRGSDFVVDYVTYHYFSGFCMKCHAEGDFLRIDKKPKVGTKKPRSINNKIKKARAKM